MWPRCLRPRCGKTAQPGVACDRETCPFSRVRLDDGKTLVIGRPGLTMEVRGGEQEKT